MAQYGEQEESLDEILKKAQKHIKIVELLSSANKSLEEGDYDSAIRAVNDILKLDPSNVEAQAIKQELIELEREEAEEARKQADKAIQIQREAQLAAKERAEERALAQERARREAAEAAEERAIREAKAAREDAEKAIIAEELAREEAEEARREAEKEARRKAEAEAREARKAKEEAEKARREAERAAKRKAEAEARAAREEARRIEKERREAEREAKRKAKEAERQAEKERREKERIAREKAEAEARAAKEAERQAEKARREAELAERKRVEEEARALREKAKRLEKARREAEREARKKAEEEERAAREQARKAERARREAEEAEREKAEEEARALREKAKRIERARRVAEREAKRKEEQQALIEEEAKREAEEAEREKAEEELRIARERIKRIEEGRRAAADEARRKAEEEARVARDEARRKAEEERAERRLAREESEREDMLERRKELVDLHGKIARYEIDKKAEQQKAWGYIGESEEFLEKGMYSDARGHAFKAREKDPKNPKIAPLIQEIDREEIYMVQEERKDERKEEMAKAAREAMIDVYEANKEGKGWMKWLSEKIGRKKYTLGEVQSGREYTIDECVELALRRNPRTVLTEQQVKLSEIRVWEAYRDLMPNVTARYERTTGQIGAQGMSRHYKGHTYQVEMKHTVFDGMEQFFTLRQAKTNLDITKLEKAKVENEIIEETKRAYYSLDKSIKALDMQGKFKVELNRYHDIAEKAYNEDLIPRTGYLKIKALNMQFDFNYISGEEDVKLAEVILFQAMNMDPDEYIRIKPVEPPKETISIGLENCYELALANNPEFRIKAKVIEYYNFERKMQKAKGWPKVYFDGSFGASIENYQPLNDPSDYRSDGSGPARSGRTFQPQWYAGVRTSIPFFGNTFEHNYVKETWAPTVSAFRGTESATNYFTFKVLDNMTYFADVQEAKVGFDRAKYEYNKQKQDVLIAVKEKYFQYRKNILQMDVARAQLEHQRAYVDVLVESLRFGEMEIHKVMEEIEKLQENEYGMISVDTGYYLSLVSLNAAIGLPNYFKPAYEKKEYEEFLKKTEQKRKEKEANKTEEEKIKDKYRNITKESDERARNLQKFREDNKQEDET